MSLPKPLDSAEIADRVRGLPGWAVTNGKLHREFTFKDFVDAFRFMTGAAFEAERLQHHPEWSNVYNVVDVTLTTHACDGLSPLDLDLARRLDKLAGAAEVQRDHSEPVECLCKLQHGAGS